jgi:hypothetical protein
MKGFGGLLKTRRRLVTQIPPCSSLWLECRASQRPSLQTSVNLVTHNLCPHSPSELLRTARSCYQREAVAQPEPRRSERALLERVDAVETDVVRSAATPEALQEPCPTADGSAAPHRHICASHAWATVSVEAQTRVPARSNCRTSCKAGRSH